MEWVEDGGADRAEHFLGRLSATAADRLRYLGTAQRFGARERLIRTGEPGDQVLVLLSGRGKLVTVTSDGSEVILDFGIPGDLYGEMAVLSGQPRMATLVALEPVQARRIAAPLFQRFLREHPDARQEAWVTTMYRLRAANAQRATLQGDVTARLARRLAELAQRFPAVDRDGIRIDLPLSQRELAQLVPTSDTSVENALTRLRSRGVLLTRYRTVVITDLAMLREGSK